jgi:hypothetical protein
MIEVVSLSKFGVVVDIAEAETPEAALLAARTLIDDYRAGQNSALARYSLARLINAASASGSYPTARFEVDGKVVSVEFARTEVPA